MDFYELNPSKKPYARVSIPRYIIDILVHKECAYAYIYFYNVIIIIIKRFETVHDLLLRIMTMMIIYVMGNRYIFSGCCNIDIAGIHIMYINNNNNKY